MSLHPTPNVVIPTWMKEFPGHQLGSDFRDLSWEAALHGDLCPLPQGPGLENGDNNADGAKGASFTGLSY